MNGPIAFSRTVRALERDSFRIPNFFLVLAFALLAGWIWWFLDGSVPQYETAREVRAEPNRLVAEFQARVLDRVRPGQSAIVHIAGQAIPAKVSAIGVEAVGGQVRAILLPETETLPPETRGQSVDAAVEVERVTPANLTFRAIGIPER
jgi:hypothetical protein